MTADEMAPDLSFSKQNFELYHRHFPQGLDEITAVLKAHLFIESMLRDFLARCFPQPSHLAGARLTFKQVSLIARSLCPATLAGLTKAWTLIDKLNTLRNAMAHELDPDESKLKGYKASIISTIGAGEGFSQESFAPALGFVCGFVACHLQMVLLIKDPEYSTKTAAEKKALFDSVRQPPSF